MLSFNYFPFFFFLDLFYFFSLFVLLFGCKICFCFFFLCCFCFSFFFFFVALVNSEACGFFKGKSMTRKVEAWREEALEGPGRGNLDQALCHPLRREGRVTARVESKAGIWGRWEHGRVSAPGSDLGRASRMQRGLVVLAVLKVGMQCQSSLPAGRAQVWCWVQLGQLELSEVTRLAGSCR